MINTVSAMSGFVGPYVIGLLKGSSGDFRSGFLVLSLASVAGAVMAMRLRHAPRLAADVTASPKADGYAVTQPS
jgi:ACS family tartrate transporter-like MFS transporter